MRSGVERGAERNFHERDIPLSKGTIYNFSKFRSEILESRISDSREKNKEKSPIAEKKAISSV